VAKLTLINVRMIFKLNTFLKAILSNHNLLDVCPCTVGKHANLFGYANTGTDLIVALVGLF